MAPLTFAAVDELAYAGQKGLATDERELGAAESLGPLVEACHLATAGLVPGLRPTSFSLDGCSEFVRELARETQYWIKPGGSLAILRASTPTMDEHAWAAFGMEAQRGALATGFDRRTAQELIGAFCELFDNVYEHSGYPNTGLAAFRCTGKTFEMCCVDQGVGVLESLRQCPKYAGLADHGEALQLALSDGVSRFGETSGRGYGFRALFVGLANHWGYLRFRSGDQALTIDGRSPSTATAKVSQKPYSPGLVVSVSCSRSQPLQRL